jgi:L,D-transpeptidase YcbB
MTRALRLSALVLLLASPTMPGAMQTALAPSPDASQLGLQRVQPQPPAAPAASWTRGAAQELLRYVEGIGQEGLSPASYSPDRLRAAIAGNNEAQLNSVAGPIFMQLAADLSGGSVRGRARVDWHMTHVGLDAAGQQRLMEQVLRGGGGVGAALDSLLPTHVQYGFLKRALANTPAEDETRRNLIRTNLERWRWLPRNLGSRHVLVNVPAFTAALIDNGNVTARHRTVVGARRTPTPQLNATITAVTINPWWNVPQSIIRENGGRFGAGYQVTRGAGGGMSVRQPPGPRNALGRVKIEMPNEHAIYLHDTPSQSLFGRPVRAFSHGCIRTQNVRDFAARLLAPTGQWDRAAIDQGVVAGRTRTVSLAQPIPVYIAYFTAAATNDGNVVTYADIYGRDAPVRQALTRADGARQADGN